MLENTKKNHVYQEICGELKKQEPSFNGEIYNFDELLKQEKTLKIIEFIKEQLILILENTDGKKIAIQLIKGEQNYFASVINVNSHKNMFDTENKKEFLFKQISDFNTIKIKQKFYNSKTKKNEEIEIDALYFIAENFNGEKTYIIKKFETQSHLLLDWLERTYTTYQDDFSKELPTIENFINNKKNDSI